MIERPMLAAPCKTPEELLALKYPMYVSPKLDGIRLLCHPTLGPVTRKFKMLPNAHARGILGHTLMLGFDGELMVPIDGKFAPFNVVHSHMMSMGGRPGFEYHVFDDFTCHEQVPYQTRLDILNVRVQQCNSMFGMLFREHFKLVMLPQLRVNSGEEALELANKLLAEGWEGIVLRDPFGPYKSNRSTLKQQWMVKYKGVMDDAEGSIVGFEELLRNKNDAETDILGLTDRSSRKEGMVPANTLGAFLLHTQWGDVSCGSGLDSQLRDEVWNNRDAYLGKVVTFKFTRYGMKDKPRFPIFKGFRED